MSGSQGPSHVFHGTYIFISKPQIFNYNIALLLKELLAKSKINLDVFKCRSSLLLFYLEKHKPHNHSY